MTRKAYQPGPPAEVVAQREGERWTLVFVRELRHPPDKVWSALTDPSQLNAWAPFDANRNLGATGPALLTMAGGSSDEKPMQASVQHADAPNLLVYDWGGDLLRWELQAVPSGTRLTLRHTVQDKSWLSKVAAGWHICLDVAERNLCGEPVGRIVAEEAREYGWDVLNDTYAAKIDTRE